MATPLLRSPLIAVDTNVPLDLADEKEHAFDALDVVRRRLKPGRILVTPTVFQELVFLADESDTPVDCEQARRALRGLAGWGLELVNLVPVGHGIVERIADKLQEAGLLPFSAVPSGLGTVVAADAGLKGGAISGCPSGTGRAGAAGGGKERRRVWPFRASPFDSMRLTCSLYSLRFTVGQESHIPAAL
jgi:predicted nucleic acid-binding protein